MFVLFQFGLGGSIPTVQQMLCDWFELFERIISLQNQCLFHVYIMFVVFPFEVSDCRMPSCAFFQIHSFTLIPADPCLLPAVFERSWPGTTAFTGGVHFGLAWVKQGEASLHILLAQAVSTSSNKLWRNFSKAFH